MSLAVGLRFAFSTDVPRPSAKTEDEERVKVRIP